ncbi:sulfurtransferase TusA family protein [Candidatus Acetothermia bacterium]|nr:sulfurtransferase TusA family protein [Candidatus Acetothermia bacterium]MBI3659689.1 sulfurtransferase TusA family protein [Candidatus Acetothermia bacterium]
MSVATKTLHKLDVRGEICPYPQMMTKKKIEALRPGEQLEVLLDYPLSLETIPRWAENAGHKILGIEKTGDAEWRILLEKGSQ